MDKLLSKDKKLTAAYSGMGELGTGAVSSEAELRTSLGSTYDQIKRYWKQAADDAKDHNNNKSTKSAHQQFMDGSNALYNNESYKNNIGLIY